VSALAIHAPIPLALELIAPVLIAAGMALVLQAHAARRGGWDRVSSLAVLGAGALALLVLGFIAYWFVFFATQGFADQAAGLTVHSSHPLRGSA
jgi:hypothetical protein